MKKIICPLLMALAISLSAFIVLSDWKVKEPYEVKFSGGKIHGEFKGLKASIKFDKAHPEQAAISASIDPSTIATGFFLKNSHVKDALDVDKYPVISFSSTEVSKSSNGYDARGKLSMKGVTLPVTIHFTFDDKGSQGIFKGSFKIIPKEFNITHKGTPDELTILLTVPVVN